MNIATSLSDLVSVTDLARTASKLIGRLLSGESEQMVVLRNNKPAAVIITPDAYERFINAVEELETMHDIQVATARAQKSRDKDLSLEELAERLGIS